jgi:hypothetical protein
MWRAPAPHGCPKNRMDIGLRRCLAEERHSMRVFGRVTRRARLVSGAPHRTADFA